MLKIFHQKQIKKIVASAVLATVFFTQSFRIDIAYAATEQKEYKLIAILVDERIWSNEKTFTGLRNEYSHLSERTMRQRVDRYAEDIQKALPFTKTAIVTVSNADDPAKIAHTLEKLYFEGLTDSKENSKLVGAVLVGDIPLPVVNKNGNKFISLYPYTDFEEKTYIFNSDNNDFELNPDAQNSSPEIWHGVITSPTSYVIEDCAAPIASNECVDFSAYENVATFLDKNHMYRLGIEGYNEFDNSFLFADTVSEAKLLNEIGYNNYERYLRHFEDTSYHRFTKELAEDLYVEVNGELSGGDKEDNDGDGAIDEDPYNGVDDDGDGLIDEDDGDPEDLVDNDGDGVFNEDGRDDNNLDVDNKTDEDGPGDMGDDGCAGECEKDDDRDCKDFDKDGLRSYIENEFEASRMFGSAVNAFKKKLLPFPAVTAILVTTPGLVRPHNKVYCTDEPPNFTDPNCFESGHVGDADYFHPEWDDDEDGRCDEDGKADNDNDGDGLFDEDPGYDDKNEDGVIDWRDGVPVDTSPFADLPDIQSKNLIERYLQPYYSMFEKHLGNVNNFVENTGRYNTKNISETGLGNSDTDTLISLISKKDDFVKNFLRAQNEYLEKKIDTVVNEIQKDIPILAGATLTFESEFDHDDDDDTDPVILESGPIRFANHSVKSQSEPLPSIWGVPANQITSAIECSLYMGTICEDGDDECEKSKLIETNRVYDPFTAGAYNRDTDDDQETYPDDLKDGEAFGGCYGTNIENREWCFPENSKAPIRSVRGTKKVEAATGVNISADYRACFDFKESTNFMGTAAGQHENFLYYAEKVSDLAFQFEKNGKILSWSGPAHPSLESSGCCGTGPGVEIESEEEFNVAFDYFKDWLVSIGAKASPYTALDSLVYLENPNTGNPYTLAMLFEQMGFDLNDPRVIFEELFVNGPIVRTIDNPFGPVESVEMRITKEYIAEVGGINNVPVVVTDENLALKISSVVAHKEPTSDTIMQQSINQLSKDLPVDSPRYITFKGQDDEFYKVVYPNLFSFDSIDEFRDSLIAKDVEIVALPDAEDYETLLQDTIENELNREMIIDAINWKNMNIDDKHQYMLTVLLSETEDPFVSHPKNGYEIMHLVAEGEADEIYYGFNGGAPREENDLEWIDALNQSANAQSAAEVNGARSNSSANALEGGSAGSGSSGGTHSVSGSISAVPLFEWIDAMVEWIDGLREDYSNFDYEAICGEFPLGQKSNNSISSAPLDFDVDGIPDDIDPSPLSYDVNDDKIPDGANLTDRLSLIADKLLLKASKDEVITLTVFATDFYDEKNTSDAVTQVELRPSKNDANGNPDFNGFTIISQNPSPLKSGKTEFKLLAPNETATVSLRAVASNRVGITPSNSVSINAVEKRLQILTYVYEKITEKFSYEEEVLENLVFKTEDENAIAKLNVESAKVTMLNNDFQLLFVPASTDSSAHGAFENTSNEKWKIPFEIISFTIKNANKDISVNEEKGIFTISNHEKIATLKKDGKIFISPKYLAKFDDNTLTNVSVFDKENKKLFDMSFVVDLEKLLETKVSFAGDFIKAETDLIPEKEVTIKKAIPKKTDSTSARYDSDSDKLEDLEEKSLGTDYLKFDSDADSFGDFEEVVNGFNPLKKGEKLFTDLNVTHKFFKEVIQLYIRGVLTGYSDRTFRPEANLSREEFVKINLGASCIDCTALSESMTKQILDEYNSSPFPDTNISEELLTCVAQGKIEGIVSGYKGEKLNGYFVPLNAISRAEAIKVLIETSVSLGGNTDLEPDALTNKNLPWFYNYILKAHEIGLFKENIYSEIGEYSKSKFESWYKAQTDRNGLFQQWLNKPITRGEFSAMVQTIFDLNDCREDDQDNDGLSDNSEKYQFGTLFDDPDTDKGGIKDGREVVIETDPLNAVDDKSRADPIIEKSPTAGLAGDTDNDGLSDLEELALGLDRNSDDSDDDGISDLDEFIQRENLTSQYKSLIIEKEVVSVQKTDDKLSDSNVIVPTNLIPVSKLTNEIILEAQILDKDGRIDAEDSSSVIEFITKDGDHAVIDTTRIKAENGIVKTAIKSKELAGDYSFDAKIVDKLIAPDNKLVIVHPLEPVRIEFDYESNTMQAGVISKLSPKILLKDQFNNLSYNNVYEVDLTLTGPATFITPDENEEKDGMQIKVMQGEKVIEMQSTEESGAVVLKATLDSDTKEISGVFNGKSEKEISLVITRDVIDLYANGESETALTIKAVNGEGSILTGFNETVVLTNSDFSKGIFKTTDSFKLEKGIGTAIFKSGYIAGKTDLRAISSGAIPGSLSLDVKPLQPKYIKLESDNKTIPTGNETETISISAYDENGNFTSQFDGGIFEVSITPSTLEYGELLNDTPIQLTNGRAQFQIKSKELSGPIRIIAKDVNGAIASGTIELQAKKKYDYNDVIATSPQILVGTVFGTDAGDITKENNIGSTLAVSGKTQAVVSLTAKPEQFAKRGFVRGNGNLSDVDSGYAYTKIEPSKDKSSPTIFGLKDILSDRTILEVFIKTNATKRMYANLPEVSEKSKGIILNSLSDDIRYAAVQNKNGLSFTFEDQEIARVNSTGQINLFDPSFTLELVQNSNYPLIEIKKANIVFAEIHINLEFNSDMTIVDSYQNYSTLPNGIYLIPSLQGTGFKLEKSVQGNSTKSAVSYALTDTRSSLPKEQIPGQVKKSLEHAHSFQGIGFENDNKLFLHFAAGATIGEAFKNNASEIGIVLGDPTIALKPNVPNATGFDTTIGTKIFEHDKKIIDIVPFDYDGDGLDEVLISDEDGKINIANNKHSKNQFEILGEVLHIKNGIVAKGIGDFDDDGRDDLIVAGKEKCMASEPSCVNIYWNKNGQFIRKNPLFNLKNPVTDLKIGDLNNDDYPDVVITDTGGTIYAFFNLDGKFQAEPVIVGDLGAKIIPDKNLKGEILVNHSAMKANNINSSADDSEYRLVSVIDESVNEKMSSISNLSEEKDVNIAPTLTKKSESFILLPFDDSLYTSSKYGKDLNGETAQPTDEVEYTITLSNTGASNINSLRLTDLVSDALVFDKTSLSCENCGTEYSAEFTKDKTRPFVINNIAVAKNSSAIVKYKATVKAVPKVVISLIENANKPGIRDDDFMDIIATTEGNSTNTLTYFYSDIPVANGIRYLMHQENPATTEAPENAAPSDAINRNELLDDLDEDPDPDEAPDEVKEQFQTLTQNDRDGDGLPDMWDTVEGDISNLSFSMDAPTQAIEQVLDVAGAIVEDVIAKMQCGGGCFAMPVNMSLLTPGQFNLFGIPVGFDNGVPLFGWGATNVSTVCTASLCETSNGGRLYLSPTINGGLVFALCLGPKSAGQCWAFNIPILQALGVCDTINSGLDSVRSKAQSVVSSANGSSAMALPGVTQGAEGEGSGGLASYNLGNYAIPSQSSTNVRIGGFPSTFTDWIDRQTEELGDVLDLPDIYFIYPDPQSIIGSAFPKKGEEVKVETLYDALNFINSLPLINVQTKKHKIRIPAVTQDEIAKMQAEWTQVLANLKNQLSKYENASLEAANYSAEVQSALNSPQARNFMNEMEEMIRTIEKNIVMINEYAELPYKIMDYRYAITSYVTQIICYIDTIIDFSAGYFIKNKNRVKAWITAIQNIVKSVATWKDLLNLSVSYQESCDKCTTSRLSLTELMMKMFVTIPSPPIVDLPKWPDIVIDISNIQAGVTLYFPEFIFEPEPLTLPKIPQISIPDLSHFTKPEFFAAISFPEIPVLPEIPMLPELPALPGLPLPKLPDIPPPPDFPELPQGLTITSRVLQKVIKIICLVKNGFTPVNESQLKTKVEELTARSSDIILPIDKSVTFQSPDLVIDLFDRIEINTKVNIQVDDGIIQKGIEALVDGVNTLTDEIVNLSDQAVELIEELPPTALYDENPITNQSTTLAQGYLQMKNAIAEMEEETDSFNQKSKEFSKEIVLKAETEIIDKSDPRLHRTLSELELKTAPEGSLVSNEINELQNIKQGLISYTKQMNDNNSMLSDFVEVGDMAKMYASLNMDTTGLKFDIGNANTNLSANASDPFIAQKSEFEVIMSDTDNAKNTFLFGEQIATNEATVMARSATAAAPTSAEQIMKGIFIYNEEEKIAERIVDYTSESGSGHKMLLQDFDKDGDDDMVYTMRNELYYKENYTEGRKLTYYNKPAKVYKLVELAPFAPAVNSFKVVSLNGNGVETSWAEQKNAIAYELELKNSISDFQSLKKTKSDKILAVPREANQIKQIEKIDKANLTILDGSIKVESTLEAENEVSIGDIVETENNSEVLIEFGDISKIKLEENSILAIPDVNSPQIELQLKGEASILSDDKILSTTAPRISTEKDSTLTINLQNNQKIIINENNSFTVPEITKAKTVLSDTEDTKITDLQRQRLSRGDSELAKPLQIIHAIKNTTIEIVGSGETRLILNAGSVINLPSTLEANSKVNVLKGEIELIDPSSEITEQKGYKGMLLTENAKIFTEDNATIVHNEKYKITLLENESLQILEINNPAKPQLSLKLPNGNYYAKIRSITADGKRGTAGKHILFAPQECLDLSEPIAQVGPNIQKLAVFKTLTLDASSSIDTNGNVIEYYYDLDLEKDLDNDGDPTNDKEVFTDNDPNSDTNKDGDLKNDGDEPKITIGPFYDLIPRKMKLWIKDSGGNLASQDITIQLYVPDITLSPILGKERIVQGTTIPSESNMPLQILRKRDDVLSVVTDSDGNNLFYTDENGNYLIDNFSAEEEINILNENDEKIGVIDALSGRITNFDDEYILQAVPADKEPTKIIQMKKTGEVLLTTYLISSSNSDVKIHNENVEFAESDYPNLQGVNLYLPYDQTGVIVKNLSSVDPLYPGGAEVVKDSKRLSLITADGFVYVYDESASLVIKEAELPSDHYVLTLQIDNKPITDILISTGNGQPTITQFKPEYFASPIINTSEDSDFDSLSDNYELLHMLDPSTADSLEDKDGDGLPNYAEAMRGTNPNSRDTDNDGVSDFDEIMLDRDPLVKEDSIFSDLETSHPQYERIVNLHNKKIIEGYKNKNEIEFKGNNKISRAEFTKILLNALCITPREAAYLQPEVFTDIRFSNPLNWIFPVTKESYFRGFVTGYIGEANSDGVSPFKPNQTINFAETAKIIAEVLSKFETTDGTKVLKDITPLQGSTPWYEPYVKLAQNLNTYLEKPSKSNFILTKEEAEKPSQTLSRFDFVNVATRVLDVYSCFEEDTDNDGIFNYIETNIGSDLNETDSDNDGLTDYQELIHGTDPNEKDSNDFDGDGLTNNQENLNDTNPYLQDSDFGGVFDGDEAENDTDPNDKDDDKPSPLKEITEKEFDDGITIGIAECVMCPCPVKVENSAQIRKDDMIFTAIMHQTTSEILSASKPIKFETVE